MNRNRSISLALRSFDPVARTCDCVASTDAIDSYGEIVDQSSWDLSRYATNPIVLFGHDASTLPIGRASNVRVERGALRATITFATAAANPLAEHVFQLVKEGVLGAVSVGFVAGAVTTETRDGRPVDVLSNCCLHELSVVNLPANEEALMRARAAPNYVQLYGEDAAAAAVTVGGGDLADIAIRHAAVAGLDPGREGTDLARLALTDAAEAHTKAVAIHGRAPTTMQARSLAIEPAGVELALIALAD